MYEERCQRCIDVGHTCQSSNSSIVPQVVLVNKCREAWARLKLPSSYKELLDNVVLSSVHETCLLNHSAATYLTSAFKTTCTLPCTGHAHWPVGSAARTVDAFPVQSNCKNRLSASLSHLRPLIQGISCRVQPAYEASLCGKYCQI